MLRGDRFGRPLRVDDSAGHFGGSSRPPGFYFAVADFLQDFGPRCRRNAEAHATRGGARQRLCQEHAQPHRKVLLQRAVAGKFLLFDQPRFGRDLPLSKAKLPQVLQGFELLVHRRRPRHHQHAELHLPKGHGTLPNRPR